MGAIDAFRKTWGYIDKILKKAVTIVVALVVIALLLGGISIIALGVTYEPTLDTQVQATIVDTENNTEDGGEGYRDRYELYVTYAYEYEGERYESERITPLTKDLQFDSEEARREAIEEKYRVGNTVVAYIDADKPDKSGLEKAEPERNIGGGVIMIVIALFISGWFRRRHRQ